MAVLKSTAYGQVRKSVGANNYYRRAGVQLVRSKPTFAPGRQFTEAQLLQQYVMKLVQYLLLTQNAKIITDYCNVANNKLYNASSRYNRFLRHTMKKVRAEIGTAMPDFEDFWNENGIFVLQDFSVGNMEWFATDVKFATAGNGITFSVAFDSTIMRRVLAQVNKKRAASSQFTVANMGMCGFFNEEPATGGALIVLPPVMNSSGFIDLEENLVFEYTLQAYQLPTTTLELVPCFFVCDRLSQAEALPLSIPQNCTSSRWIREVSKGADNPDLPVID